MKIEIKKIGNSDGLLLPRELMQRLGLKRGQELHITELAGGGFQALPYDPDFEKTMEIVDEIIDEYRDTLAALAKGPSRNGSLTSRRLPRTAFSFAATGVLQACETREPCGRRWSGPSTNGVMRAQICRS